MQVLQKTKAFTIMELVIVVTVLGILASLALPRLWNSVEKSRAAEGVQILNTLLKEQDVFEFENGSFADTIAELSIEINKPSYFQPIDDTAIVPGNLGYVATVRRLTNTYELCIQPDGDIFCDNIGGNSVCDTLTFTIVANCPEG